MMTFKQNLSKTKMIWPKRVYLNYLVYVIPNKSINMVSHTYLWFLFIRNINILNYDLTKGMSSHIYRRKYNIFSPSCTVFIRCSNSIKLLPQQTYFNIWPPVTTDCLYITRKCSMENDLNQLVIQTAEEYFAENHNKDGIKRPRNHWNKCQ